MNINVSFSSSTDMYLKTGISDTAVEELFAKVVDHILANDQVKTFTRFPKLFEGVIEELEVDLYLCNNEEIRKLNKQYRQVDSATDVLSFALPEDEYSCILPIVHLGEVVISVDKLVEQSEQSNKTNKKELVFLIAHGVLHLLGLTHDTDQSYENIIKIQNEIVNMVVNE